MLQLPPPSRIFVATQPVEFRKGMDGLCAVCRQGLGDNPLEGAVYVGRNRAGTALTLLLYDGQGYWLCLKRLSQGRFTGWPTTVDAHGPLCARDSSYGCGMVLRRAPTWPTLGVASPQAGPAAPASARATTPRGWQRPRREAPATLRGPLGHGPPRGGRGRSPW